MGSRIRFTSARQVFEAFPDLAESVDQPSGDMSPQDFTNTLMNGEEPFWSVEFFAHVLPKREAVWWGLKCVAGLDAPESTEDRQILELVDAWVREGDEEARQAVAAAVDDTRSQGAAVWIGRAAAWSGGSLSPNPDQRVEMPEDLTARALNAAVVIAIGNQAASERQNALASCISAGLAFAAGGAMPVIVAKHAAAAG